MREVEKIIEAIIFVAEEPITAKEIAERLDFDAESILHAIKKIKEKFTNSGIVLDEIAGGYKFYTNPAVSSYVKKFIEDKPIKLSRHLLEVLAIVAYKQPVAKKEIETIRGKNCDGAIKSLLEKHLIEVIGRKKGPGRAKLYGTTKEFLIHFGLKTIEELPSFEMEELIEK